MSTVSGKWSRTPRVACSKCGRPTGWKLYEAAEAGAPTCNSCRSDYSKFEHGTARGYRLAKCRCSLCTAWNREEQAAYRQKRRAEGRPIRHFGSSGPWISDSVRMSVFDRDGWCCQICGGDLDRGSEPNSNWFPSIDHVVPQSKGGGHEVENLRAAHRWCNSVRQDREVGVDG